MSVLVKTPLQMAVWRKAIRLIGGNSNSLCMVPRQFYTSIGRSGNKTSDCKGIATVRFAILYPDQTFMLAATPGNFGL